MKPAQEIPGSVGGRIGMIGPGQGRAVFWEKITVDPVIFGRYGIGRPLMPLYMGVDGVAAEEVDAMPEFQPVQVLAVRDMPGRVSKIGEIVFIFGNALIYGDPSLIDGPGVIQPRAVEGQRAFLPEEEPENAAGGNNADQDDADQDGPDIMIQPVPRLPGFHRIECEYTDEDTCQ